MRMMSTIWRISKYGAAAARAQSLTFYASARLNRYPRITDAEGIANLQDLHDLEDLEYFQGLEDPYDLENLQDPSS